MSKKNGFWYDVFHLKSAVNWWVVLYLTSWILAFILALLTVVSFVQGYWYCGVLGILLDILGIRIVIASLTRS